MKLLSLPPKLVSIFAGSFAGVRLGRTASAFLSEVGRRHFRNGWKATACRTYEALTKPLDTLRPGRKNILRMSKRARNSRGNTISFFCVSLNPAIDTRLVLNEFRLGRVNRVSEVHGTPGGKAAQVAVALQGVGANPTWIGFSGGSTGNELLAGLRQLQIETVSTPTVQHSRVNLEIVDAQGRVTEILEPGGTIVQPEWSQFQRICTDEFRRIASKKIAIISGSQPPGVPTEATAALLKSAHSANCLAFIDSSGLPFPHSSPPAPHLPTLHPQQPQTTHQL